MTARTISERFRRLLSHGYFAPELPPCFVSSDLAKYRTSILKSISAMPDVRGKPAFHRYASEPSWFYFPRFGKNDRRHGVPNPISYLLLSHAVSKNYLKLQSLAKKSRISSSPPIFDWNGSRAIVRSSIDLRDKFRVDLASRYEEFVSTDIRAFYHSIYTHAIPWAIHGKEFAKRNRGLEHFGNLLDMLCRNGQGGQTIGLPVGPDCSRIIAEVIASAIDVSLCDKLGIGPRDASRYVDDYTIGSGDRYPGNSVIAALRDTAAEYELELNNEKSGIISTSARLELGWKEEVLSLVPKSKYDDAEFQRFFYRLGQVCNSHLDTNIEKYAYQNARIAFINAVEWPNIQNYLISAYRRNSSLVSFLVEILILRQAKHSDVHLLAITEFLERRLPILARENRTGEIIWLLFLAARLRIVLSSKTFQPITNIENSMIALLASWCAYSNLIEGTISFDRWNLSLNTDGLRGGMWLYAYESVMQGINPETSKLFIESDPYFSILLKKRISFYSIQSGFSSMSKNLRSLRADNRNLQYLRDDFMADFVVDINELDSEDTSEMENDEY